jgi:diacylglycerol O-acyltransferase
MQQLSSLDASFLYFETPNAPMHVGGIMIYDQSTAPGGKVTFRGILSNFEKRLHLARCFRQRLAYVPFNLDHPYWIEDPDFDLEFHVRHIALPKPGDWRQLCIQAARLHSRPLDHNHPLWEIYVIEGLDNVPELPKGSFAIVFKIHHAAIDGVTGAEIISALHDLDPASEPPQAKKEWSPDSVPGDGELLTRTMFNNVIYPLRLGRIMGESVPAMARAPGSRVQDASARAAHPLQRNGHGSPRARRPFLRPRHDSWDEKRGEGLDRQRRGAGGLRRGASRVSERQE